MIYNLLADLVEIYLVVLFLRMILTWIPINPWSRAAKVERVLVKVTDPVLVPVRRLLPPLRIGAVGLDLSATLVFVALLLLYDVLRSH